MERGSHHGLAMRALRSFPEPSRALQASVTERGNHHELATRAFWDSPELSGSLRSSPEPSRAS
eukprot:14365263-Alexandrium_andersonii.AAC.1